MRKYLHWLLPLAFCLSVSGATLFLYFFGAQLSVTLTNILSVAYFIFLPLVPLLKPLGLTEGTSFHGPSPLGVAMGMAIYGLILYGLGRWIQKVVK